MRCAEVVQELAVPTGAVEAGALERHLADCPRCAERAEAGRRFDRLWAATRPAEPASDLWPGLWQRVQDATDTAPVPRIVPVGMATGRRRRRWLVGTLIVAAQAASILLTALVVHRFQAPGPAPLTTTPAQLAARAETPAPEPPAVAMPHLAVTPPSSSAPDEALAQRFEFELDDGQTLFFELDESGDSVVIRPRLIETVDLAAFEDDDTTDPYVEMAVAVQADMQLLNFVEGLQGGAFVAQGHDQAQPTPAGDATPPEPRDPEAELPSTSRAPRAGGLVGPLALALTALVAPTSLPAAAADDTDTDQARSPSPRPAASSVAPHRQVTVFGVTATPDDPTIDPQLAEIAAQLRRFKPDHGFRLRGVASRWLAPGEALVCNLGDGYVGRAVLDRAIVPARGGKLRITFTLESEGAATFTTTVTTPPHQLFFCEKPLDSGARLLIGVGAR